MDTLITFFSILLFALVIVWVVGVGLALSRWRLTSIVVWAFVLCAIFGWRDGPQKQDTPPPSPSTFGNESSPQNATL